MMTTDDWDLDDIAAAKARIKARDERARRFQQGWPKDDPGPTHGPSANGETHERPPMLQRLLTLDQLANLPPLEPLIHGLVDLDSLLLNYGPRGCGKSFVAVDMLASIATGHRFHGRITERHPVIYVVGEGVAGLTARFDAWLNERGLPRPTNLHILPEPVNLLNPATVGEFAAMAVDLGAKMVMFDTLARCLVGGDENSAKDAGLAIEQLDHIRRKTGAAVGVTHHSGKNIDAGGRGSTAFEGAMDTVYEISSTDSIVTIKSTKQKNHADPNPIRLRMRAVDADHVVLEDYRGGEELHGAALETLAALRDVEIAGGVNSGVWLSGSSCTERTFYRHRSGLLAAGLVTNVGTEKQPRYQVTKEGTAMLPNDCQGANVSQSKVLPPHPHPLGGGSGSRPLPAVPQQPGDNYTSQEPF